MHDILFWTFQVIGLILSIVYPMLKTEKSYFLGVIATNSSYFIYYLLSGDSSCIASQAVVLARSFTLLFKDKAKPKKWLYISIFLFFSSLHIIFGILAWNGNPFAILTIIAPIALFSAWWFSSNVTTFRVVQIFSNTCWLLNTIYIGAYVGSLIYIIGSISCIVALAKDYLKAKK